MEKWRKHIFLCGSFRIGDKASGTCEKRGALQYLPYIEAELADRGLSDVNVSATTCLKVCERGPAMIIYPDGIWYGHIASEEDVDNILDALEEDTIAKDYLLT